MTQGSPRLQGARQPSSSGRPTGSRRSPFKEFGPRTWRDYRDILNRRVLPAIGHIRLDRLQPEHLEDFYGKLLAAELSAGTVLKTHRVISRALHVAHRRGRVARNVARLIGPPRYRRAEVDPLSASEARQILEAAKGRRNTARWTVTFALGLRQGEALGLQWEHVDLERGLYVSPASPREDWGEWKDLLAAAGVRDARLHDARHTAATLLFSKAFTPAWS